MMKYHKNNINKIIKIAPIIASDTTDNKKYILKNGVYMIEYDDKSISTIDVKNNIDITNIEQIELYTFNKSKIKTIFDISLNDNLLENAN